MLCRRTGFSSDRLDDPFSNVPMYPVPDSVFDFRLFVVNLVEAIQVGYLMNGKVNR